MNNFDKNYTTYQDFLNSLGKELITESEFKKKFLTPKNNDILIEDIDVDSMKSAAKVVKKSFYI